MSFDKPLPPVFPYQPVRFVSQSEKTISKKTADCSNNIAQSQDGKDVRLFYENVIGHNQAVCDNIRESTGAQEQFGYEVDVGTEHHHARSNHYKCKDLSAYGPQNCLPASETSAEPGSLSREDLKNKAKGHDKAARKKAKSTDKMLIERTNNQFLKHAQEGNVAELMALLQLSDCNINCVDRYGWSALMCSSYSGQLEIVEVLLNNNCDITLQDSNKNTAKLLAKQAKQYRIVELIEQYVNSKREKRKRKRKDDGSSSGTSGWCPVCETSYTSDVCKHEISTVHQLSSTDVLDRTQYQIPESNRGFQIMLKSGWDKHHGLGSERQRGQKFPVKTELKRDRKGVGFSPDISKRLRVTHFNPSDVSAVDDTNRQEVRLKSDTKRIREKDLRRKRQTEINFRNEFNFS